MILGKYLKFVLAGTAFAYGAGEGATQETQSIIGGLRAGGVRELGNKKKHGSNTRNYGRVNTASPTMPPIDNQEPFPTISPSHSPSDSPVWKGDSWGPDGYPTLSPSLSPTLPVDPVVPDPTSNPTVLPSESPVWMGDSWGPDGYPTLSPSLSPTPPVDPVVPDPTSNPTVSPSESPVWTGDSWKSDGYPTLSPSSSPFQTVDESPSFVAAEGAERGSAAFASGTSDFFIQDNSGSGTCKAGRERCCRNPSINAQRRRRCRGCNCS